MNNSISKDVVISFVSFYKLIDDKTFSKRRTFTGLINPSEREKALDLLNKIKAEIPERDLFYPNYDEEDGEVEVTLPPFFYSSLTEMLEAEPLLRSEVPNQPFYFNDIDFLYLPEKTYLNGEETSAPKIIQNYLKCVSLYTLLKTQADHISSTSDNIETIYFLNTKKITIKNDLTSIDNDILFKLPPFEINFINSNIHKETIKNIINDSLNSFYIDKNISINKVCIDFDSLYDVIKNNYDTYISQFTFEKIKKEVEKFRTESITRINKAFSDIQMQIIAIPASLIVVASNLKTGSNFSFLSNSIIFLGALFFTIAVLVMCENQSDTLDNIKHEIDAQKKVFTNDPLFKDKIEINSNFTVMETRFLKQKNNIKLVKIGIYISIAIMFSTYVFIHIDNTCLSTQILLLDKYYCPTTQK
ncbi:hypothetical protein [Acinetobacter guillouiae]|uniref:hypothetical protein n=1 Tax=Acinetobacter guillouiae TaxID=106649 RepID=UPI0028D7D719|nr:hypothetical protein [Acinetobacter guillouiae]